MFPNNFVEEFFSDGEEAVAPKPDSGLKSHVNISLCSICTPLTLIFNHESTIMSQINDL